MADPFAPVKILQAQERLSMERSRLQIDLARAQSDAEQRKIDNEIKAIDLELKRYANRRAEEEAVLKRDDRAFRIFKEYAAGRDKQMQALREFTEARAALLKQAVEMSGGKVQGLPGADVIGNRKYALAAAARDLDQFAPRIVEPNHITGVVTQWEQGPSGKTARNDLGNRLDAFAHAYLAVPPGAQRQAVLAQWTGRIEGEGAQPGLSAEQQRTLKEIDDMYVKLGQESARLATMSPQEYVKGSGLEAFFGRPVLGQGGGGQQPAGQSAPGAAPPAEKQPEQPKGLRPADFLGAAPDSPSHTIGPVLQVGPHSYSNVAFSGMTANDPYLAALRKKTDEYATKLKPLFDVLADAERQGYKRPTTQTTKNTPRPATPAPALAPVLSPAPVGVNPAGGNEAQREAAALDHMRRSQAGEFDRDVRFVAPAASSPPAGDDYTPIVGFFKAVVPDRRADNTLAVMEPILDGYVKQTGADRHKTRSEWINALRQNGWADLK